MSVTITPIYVSACAVIYLGLSCWVVVGRRRLGVGMGDGGERSLERAIRTHGNFAEYVPLLLLMLLILELKGADVVTLHGVGLALVVSRALHASGTLRRRGTSFGRFWGAGISFLLLPVMAVMILL